MATTVNALLEVLERTSPPEPKWNVRLEGPNDPNVIKRLKDLKLAGKLDDYKDLILSLLVSCQIKTFVLFI